MKINLKIEYNLETEIERIADTCNGISNGFFQEKRFLLVKTPPKGKNGTVYLPDLDYNSIPDYWKKIRELSKYPNMKSRKGFDIFKQMQVLPIQVINEKVIKAFKGEFYKKIEEFEKELIVVFPQLKGKVLNIFIRPTQFGTMGTFSEMKNQNNELYIDFVYLRLDSNFSVLVSAVVSSIVKHLKNCDWHDEKWAEKQSIVEFILENTSLSKLISNYENAVTSLRKPSRKSDKVTLESKVYYAKLGFPINEMLNLKNGNIYANDEILVDLTESEKKIVKYMIDNKNTVISYEEIGSMIWEDDDDRFSLWAISKVIQRIRDKIRRLIKNTELIHSIRNVGYVLYD